MPPQFSLKNIINKQLNTLLKAQLFLKSKDINNPKLEGDIWNILVNNKDNKNLTQNIDYLTSQKGWAITLSLKLQRILVDYQLHQLKLGRSGVLFVFFSFYTQT